MDYFIMEMWNGIWTLRNTIPLSGFIFLGVICIELLIKFIQKKKINFKISNLICQYLWILIILCILKITGILTGNFGITSPFDSYISFKLFEEGFNVATILNILLFIPFGFLPIFIFKNIHKHWWNGIILGGIFSISIEFLQTFIGRFAQLDDVIMNTLGTLIGFLLGLFVMSFFKNKLVKK